MTRVQQPVGRWNLRNDLCFHNGLWKVVMAFLLLKVADLVQNWKIRCMVWGEDELEREDELEDRLRRLIGSLHSYLEGSLGR